MSANSNHPNLLDGPVLNAPPAEPGPRGFARRITQYVLAGAIMVLNIVGTAAMAAALIVSLYAIYWFTQRVLDALGGR